MLQSRYTNKADAVSVVEADVVGSGGLLDETAAVVVGIASVVVNGIPVVGKTIEAVPAATPRILQQPTHSTPSSSLLDRTNHPTTLPQPTGTSPLLCQKRSEASHSVTRTVLAVRPLAHRDIKSSVALRDHPPWFKVVLFVIWAHEAHPR